MSSYTVLLPKKKILHDQKDVIHIYTLYFLQLFSQQHSSSCEYNYFSIYVYYNPYQFCFAQKILQSFVEYYLTSEKVLLVFHSNMSNNFILHDLYGGRNLYIRITCVKQQPGVMVLMVWGPIMNHDIAEGFFKALRTHSDEAFFVIRNTLYQFLSQQFLQFNFRSF